MIPSRIVFFLVLSALVVMDQQGLLPFRVFLPLWLCFFILAVYPSRRENRGRKTRHSSN